MTKNTVQKQGMTRRRLIKICAAATAGAVLPLSTLEGAPVLHRWKGIALGARAEINLLHEDRSEARRLFSLMEAEIRRLETIFSLYRNDSELVRLNRDGRLLSPSHELVELLSLSKRIHRATDGAFDPTVQPLWTHYASLSSREKIRAREAVGSCIGFENVLVQADEIRLSRQGMALTLNGIAQGFITDRITALLAANGCKDMVVDIGELTVRGMPPNVMPVGQAGWPVTLRPSAEHPAAFAKIELSDAAVASSAKRGTTFDRSAQLSHILDPKRGRPADTGLAAVSVVAGNAAVADGLSTGALVLGENQLRSVLAEFPDASAFVVREDGRSSWVAPSGSAAFPPDTVKPNDRQGE